MSNTAIDYRDQNAIRKAGIEALTNALGPVGMAHFMRQFDRGRGDYTAERERWLSGLSEEEFLKEVHEKDKSRQK